MERKFREVQDMLVTKMRQTDISRETHIPIKAEIDALKILLEEEEKRYRDFHHADGQFIESSIVSIPKVTYTTEKHATTGDFVSTDRLYDSYRAKSVGGGDKKAESQLLQRSHTFHPTSESLPTIRNSIHTMTDGKSGTASHDYQYGTGVYRKREPIKGYGNAYYTYWKLF